MALQDLTDRQAVLDAISEFDALGRDAFLARYGFGKAVDYFIEFEDSRYDSKAIAGAAHGYQHDQPLRAGDFSGGDATVASRLKSLGFVVSQPGDWTLPVGTITTRARVAERYGGATYGGIEPSGDTPNVMVYTDPAEGILSGYAFDGWADVEPGVFHYTGEGPRGPQVMTHGNRAILDHASAGRALRLFEAIDKKQRPGGKRHRYLGKFRVDASAPFETKQAPDADGQPRSVIVFRLVGEEGQNRANTVLVSTAPTAKPIVELIDSERNVVTEYETAPKTGTVARRREGEMVTRFEAHLRAEGHVVKRVRIRAPGESQTLVTDTYDTTTGTLYEAKSSVSRPTVRLAVGQLLDYRRFVPSATNLALLLPALVSPDLYAYVDSCGMRITYQDGDGWAVQSP